MLTLAKSGLMTNAPPPRPAANRDQPLVLELVHGFLNARAAGAEAFDQLALRREPVALGDRPAEDRELELLGDLRREPVTADRLKERRGFHS